jgi:hypothetical protein
VNQLGLGIPELSVSCDVSLPELPPKGPFALSELEATFNQYLKTADCAGSGKIPSFNNVLLDPVSSYSVPFTKTFCITPSNISAGPSYVYVLEFRDARVVVPNNTPARTYRQANSSRQVCLIPHKVELAAGEIGAIIKGDRDDAREYRRDAGIVDKVQTTGSLYRQAMNVTRPGKFPLVFQGYVHNFEFFNDTKSVYYESGRIESKFAGFFRAGKFLDLEKDFPALAQRCTAQLPL